MVTSEEAVSTICSKGTLSWAITVQRFQSQSRCLSYGKTILLKQHSKIKSVWKLCWDTFSTNVIWTNQLRMRAIAQTTTLKMFTRLQDAMWKQTLAKKSWLMNNLNNLRNKWTTWWTLMQNIFLRFKGWRTPLHCKTALVGLQTHCTVEQVQL